MIPKKPAPDLIRGGNRFPAFAKPASAGEGMSEKIMLKQKASSNFMFHGNMKLLQLFLLALSDGKPDSTFPESALAQGRSR
jgi:hypothetical protein